MIYRERLEEYESATYKFCFMVSGDLWGRAIPEDHFTYGYKIYGPGHALRNSI